MSAFQGVITITVLVLAAALMDCRRRAASGTRVPSIPEPSGPGPSVPELDVIAVMRSCASVLVAAMSERCPELGAHVCEVSMLAMTAAQRLGLSRCEVEQVRLAAELHDVGKFGIPDRILAKPSALDCEEWRIMHQHTEMGGRILDVVPSLKPVAELVRASHERHDGTGYPIRLAGAEIPLGARIISVCDAYDAMTSKRVYRDPLAPAEALRRLHAAAGSQFDPDVVTVVAEVIADLTGARASAAGLRELESRKAPALVVREALIRQ